jgi:two-component system, NtrC family, response regulator GlrR
VTQLRVLLIGSETIEWSRKLREVLYSQENVAFEVFEHVATARERPKITSDFEAFARERTVDAVIVKLSSHSPDLGECVLKAWPGIPVFLVADTPRPEEVVHLLKVGATDFITPPFTPINVLPRLLRCVPQVLSGDSDFEKLKQELGLKQLIGESEPFKELVRTMPLVAGSDSGVLIEGETGTGKELFARATHYLSPRADKPFVPVSCGAIPSELVENEFFGHERGAYTGAFSEQGGLLRLAEGGTLFLDDVDCLPDFVQPKLLRFLELGEYRPLGSSQFRTGNVRVIAAANVALADLVQKKRFRVDLYYRLNVIPLYIPPLRERPDDVLVLAMHFIRRFATKSDKRVVGLTAGAREKLLHHPWPGNVRELLHVIERGVVLSRQPLLDAADIRLRSRERPAQHESFNAAKRRIITEFERSYIERSLLAHQGNITKAAAGAGKDRRTFWELIRKHGIDAGQYRVNAG